MRITGMLAWWDEPESDLYECVVSMSALCDAVLAADGGYEMTPGATAASAQDQLDAIREAAYDADLDCNIISPQRLWKGQVEKRDAMIRLAAPSSDWLIAVDADHRLEGDRDAVRAELAETAADFIMHQFHTPVPAGVDVEAISPHAWHTEHAGETIWHSLLMRALDDMRVEEKHWGYSGVRDGERRALCQWLGSSESVPGERHFIEARFRVVHVCFSRDLERLDRNRDYCKVRDDFVTANGYEP